MVGDGKCQGGVTEFIRCAGLIVGYQASRSFHIRHFFMRWQVIHGRQEENPLQLEEREAEGKLRGVQGARQESESRLQELRPGFGGGSFSLQARGSGPERIKTR